MLIANLSRLKISPERHTSEHVWQGASRELWLREGSSQIWSAPPAGLGSLSDKKREGSWVHDFPVLSEYSCNRSSHLMTLYPAFPTTHYSQSTNSSSLLSCILSNTSQPSSATATNEGSRQRIWEYVRQTEQISGLTHHEAWMFSKNAPFINLWRKLDVLIALVKNTMWVPWDAFACYSIKIENDHLNTQETNLSGESEGTAVYLNYWLFSCDLLADKRQGHAGVLRRTLSQQFLLPSQIKNVWPNFAGNIYKSMC